MSSKIKPIAIDFDRVIHDIEHPVEGRRMGPPLPGAIEALGALEDAGVPYVVFTQRATTQRGATVVTEWLEYYGAPAVEVTAVKGDWLMIVDDLALQHLDWSTTLPEIFARLGLS